MAGKKVCIVTLGSPENPVDEFFDELEYDIFILDLDLTSHSFEESRVRISRNCIYNAAFCVYGSKLYAFASYHPQLNPDPHLWRPILKYDLPMSPCFNLKLDRTDFHEVALLNDGKLDTMATVLDDGVILVYSTEIDTRSYLPSRCDFEIFDPTNAICHQLPKFRPKGVPKNISFIITSHSVIDNHLVVQTEEVGSYALNLNSPHLWEIRTFPWASFLPSHPGHSFVVIDKALCLIPYCGIDLSDLKRGRELDLSDLKRGREPFSRWFYEFPDQSSIPEVGYRFVRGGGLTILEDCFDTQTEINLCLLKVGINSDTNQPHMFLDIYKLDLQECTWELSNIRARRMEDAEMREPLPLPGATKIKSYVIMLNVKTFFYVENFFFIQAA